MPIKISPGDDVDKNFFPEVHYPEGETDFNQSKINDDVPSVVSENMGTTVAAETKKVSSLAHSSPVDPDKPVSKKPSSQLIYSNPQVASAYGVQSPSQPGIMLGRPLPQGIVVAQPPQGVTMQQGYYVTQPRPGQFIVHQVKDIPNGIKIIPDYSCLSVFTVFCCFCPIGILALFCSWKAKKSAEMRCEREAMYFANLSLIFNIFSVIFALVALGIFIATSNTLFGRNLAYFPAI